MKLRSLLITAYALGAFSASACSLANAETIGQILAHNCSAAYHVDQMEQRAHSLADDDQYALAKKAAGLYYDCAQNASDPYVHDLARLNYLYLLSVSDPSDDERHLVQMLVLVKDQANELAASSRYPDIRSQALKLRDSTAAELSGPLSH